MATADVWDYETESLNHVCTNTWLKQYKNPYRRKPTATILPYENKPNFKITYYRGSGCICFEPTNVWITVDFDNNTDIATNNLFAPDDWGHYIKHYFKYLPLWSDIVVGDSKWRNNTHAELGNRVKKEMLKKQNNGRAMVLPDYVDITIPFNIGQQRYFIAQLRLQHADTVAKLSGYEDRWMRRNNKTATAAYTKVSVDMCESYSQYLKFKGIKSLSEPECVECLNVDFLDWKRKLTHQSIKTSKVKFSRRMVHCLQNRLELPKIGKEKTTIFNFFFITFLHHAYSNAKDTANSNDTSTNGTPDKNECILDDVSMGSNDNT